jgi:hypothetical protein
MAAGKSLITGSVDPTPGTATDDVKHIEITIAFIFNHRILHLHESRRGTRISPNMQTAELGEVERLTKRLRRTPSPERKRRDTKHPADSFTASKTPRPGPNLTLHYIQAGIRGFLTLPPPDRPLEEGGPRIVGDRGGKTDFSHKIVSLYCRWERRMAKV